MAIESQRKYGDKKYYIVVTPFFPSPSNWRGAYVLDQVKAIRRVSDYEVIVFMGGKKDDDYFIDDIHVYRYKNYSLPSNVLNGLFNGINANSFVKRVIKVGVDVKNIAFVHCHVSMQAACGLAIKKLNPSIKVLLQHHDLDPFNLRSGVLFRNKRWNIRYRAMKAYELYNKVDLHICISEACKDSLFNFPHLRKGEIYTDYIRLLELCSDIPIIHSKATYVLYNGVDTNLFNKENELVQKSKHDFFRIGCIANFNELKGHITLIKAFEILVESGYTNLRLSLLGSGEMRPRCEQYINEHGLNKYVEWEQEVHHDQLPSYYHSLDLFVLPSYFEGFGCVFTEAAACGVPFMGCKNQGYSEYIPDEDKDKWLIEPGDYKQLAKIIADYIHHRYEQNYCHTFVIDDLIKDFLEFIEKL